MKESKNENLGCGILLILVGLGIIAQRMGWFQFNVEWVLPLALIGWGAFEVLKALRK